MPSFVVDNYLVKLPSIGSFGRPVWAYDQLPDGWQVLKRLVMGDSTLLTTVLQVHRDKKLDARTAYALAIESGACDSIAQVFATAAISKTPSELASWYCEWEALVFQKYREQETQASRRR